eukprot:COSAG02_NODE_12859_length_1481_cov_1.695369_1_plen_268_part_00
MWLVQDHHTYQISYEFHNEEEIKVLREQQDKADREDVERERRAAEVEEERKELVRKQQEAYDKAEIDREIHEKDAFRESERQRLRNEQKERDKIVFSYPPPDKFHLQRQPYSVLLKALPIIRAKTGWLTQEVVREECLNPTAMENKRKYRQTFHKKRYFCVMWRHPFVQEGAYDMLKYGSDKQDSSDGPQNIEYLREPHVYKVKKAEHPNKPGKPRPDMPNGFQLMIKVSKDSPSTTVYFDPKTPEARDSWMKFLKEGPRFDHNVGV